VVLRALRGDNPLIFFVDLLIINEKLRAFGSMTDLDFLLVESTLCN
jgi:hypothetical protein